MRTAIVALAAILCGCAGLPADPTHMTPEQLTALAKDRSASASCTLASTPWGPQRTIYVQLDKATIAAGGVTVTPDCQMSIQAEAAPPRPAAAASAPRMTCYRSGADGSVVVCEPAK